MVLRRLKREEVEKSILPMIKRRYDWYNDQLFIRWDLPNGGHYCHVYVYFIPTLPTTCLNEHEVYINVSKDNDDDDYKVSFRCASCSYRVKSVSKRKEEEVHDEEKPTDTKKRKVCDYDLATILSDCIRGRCAYVPCIHSWYVFDGKKWIADKEGTQVRMKINENLLPRFEDEPHIQAAIKTTGRRDNIIKECRSLLEDVHFLDKLNGNQELVGFENGVYDFRTNTFRDAVPEDFVSYSTGCTYLHDYMTDDLKQMRIDAAKFFKDICLNDLDQLQMFLNLFGSAYNGTKRKQLFFLFEGGTSHVPSSLIRDLPM